MADAALIAGSNIDGTITVAGIQEQVLVSVDRKYPWSLIERKHYITYNIVAKKTIRQYTVVSFTGFAFVAFLLIPAIFGLMVGIGEMLPCLTDYHLCGER